MSVQSICERKLPRMQMEYYIRNRYFLDSDEVDIYYTLFWSGEYFKKQNLSGVLLKDNVTFVIIFHNCIPLTCYNSKQVQLSFRKAAKYYELPAYVLVRPTK